MTSSGSTPSRSRRACAQPCAALGLLPPVETFAQRLAGDGQAPSRRAGRAGAGAASPRARRRPGTRAPSDGRPARSGSTSTRRGTWRLIRLQSSTVGPAQPGAIGDGGDVQQQVRRAAERRVHGHRVAEGGVGEDVADRGHALSRADAARRGRAPGHVEPDRLARRRQRRVRQRQAERFGDDLRRRRRAEELAAAAGTGAGAAAQLRPPLRA